MNTWIITWVNTISIYFIATLHYTTRNKQIHVEKQYKHGYKSRIIYNEI